MTHERLSPEWRAALQVRLESVEAEIDRTRTERARLEGERNALRGELAREGFMSLDERQRNRRTWLRPARENPTHFQETRDE